MAAEECIFKFKYECSDNDKLMHSLPKKEGVSGRIDSVIRASEVYKDHIAQQLRQSLEKDPDYCFAYHKTCVSRYATPKSYKRKTPSDHPPETPCKRLRRSEVETIDFKAQCLFCCETCQLKGEDKKNPNKWSQNKAYQFSVLTTESNSETGTVEQVILSKCAERKDAWGNEVRIRISCCGDLVAAESRYHVKCRTSFMFMKNLAKSELPEKPKCEEDVAFEALIRDLSNERGSYNSVSLHALYESKGGAILSRLELFDAVQKHFGDNTLVMHVNGYVKMLVFKHKAFSVLQMLKDDNENDVGGTMSAIKTLSKTVKKEAKEIHTDTEKYQRKISKENMSESAPESLKDFLNTLASGFGDSLTGLMICNMVTGHLSGHPTPLQIALGIFLRGRKRYIKQFYAYGITCSYDEMRRFRKSAAIDSYLKTVEGSRESSGNKLRQYIADNFDCKVTHALAMISIGPPCDENDSYDDTIPRISKTDSSKPVRSFGDEENDDDMNVLADYTGKK